MYYVRRWQNDDHFKKHYASYKCPVKGCEEEEGIVEINPKNFDETDLIKCRNCGQFDVADKKVALLREIAILEKKMNEKREELALIESDLTNPS
jgi:Zn-finger protein